MGIEDPKKEKPKVVWTNPNPPEKRPEERPFTMIEDDDQFDFSDLPAPEKKSDEPPEDPNAA